MQILSTIFGLIIRLSIWRALFTSAERADITVEEVTPTEMVGYVIIIQVIRTVSQTGIGPRIAQRIVTGQIGTDLLKPTSFKLFHFSEELGESLYRIIFNTLPACLLVAPFYGFAVPLDPVNFLFFVASLIGSAAIIYQIDYIFGITVFWLKQSNWTDRISQALFSLFSGSIIPLWFYPDLLRRISLFLPYHLTSFQPLQIILGKLTPTQSLVVLIQQGVWFSALYALERVVWTRAQRVITVHGG